MTIPGRTFVYEREVGAEAAGNYSVTVPYAGEYAVGDRTVTVDESAVERGEVITL